MADLYTMQDPTTQYSVPRSREPDSKEVIALIEAEGRVAIAIPGDISQEGFCKKLITTAHKKLNGLDILALIAGKQHAV